MTVKPTSIAALNQMVLDGTCKKLRERIYEYLLYNESTRKEIAADMNIELSSVCGRVNELVKLGAISVGGTRRCRMSGKQVEYLTTMKGCYDV